MYCNTLNISILYTIPKTFLPCAFRRSDEDIEHFWFFHVKVFTQNNFSTIFVILSVNAKVFVNVTLKIDANTTKKNHHLISKPV